MNNNNGGLPAVAAEDADIGQGRSRADREMSRVLSMEVMDLSYIHSELNDVFNYLSAGDTLQEFFCECGISLHEWMVYSAMIRNSPSRLPARSFFELYYRDRSLTLQAFIQTLQRLVQKHHRINELVSALWNAALRGNSQYFRNLS
jgi:hypothetical protein